MSGTCRALRSALFPLLRRRLSVRHFREGGGALFLFADPAIVWMRGKYIATPIRGLPAVTYDRVAKDNIINAWSGRAVSMSLMQDLSLAAAVRAADAQR